MTATRFGLRGVDQPSQAPDHGRRRFLRPLPHAGDSCACARCDGLRVENAGARTMVNWPPDYPPKFYAGITEEEWRENQ